MVVYRKEADCSQGLANPNSLRRRETGMVKALAVDSKTAWLPKQPLMADTTTLRKSRQLGKALPERLACVWHYQSWCRSPVPKALRPSNPRQDSSIPRRYLSKAKMPCAREDSQG